MTRLIGTKVWIINFDGFFITVHESVVQISLLRHNFEKKCKQARNDDFED